MTVHELTGPFVSTGPIACQGGRCFVAFKPPSQQRNVLYEVDLVGWGLRPIGSVPGAYYKDGECSLCFAPNGELLMLAFCSPDPATGGAARPLIWQTGIVCPAVSGTAVDTYARGQAAAAIADVEALKGKLRAV